MNKKIIIWGYPPHTHTHSYINFGFAKAFSHLDYDVIWYEDSPEYASENLSDSIIITEVNSCNYLPIISSSKYFVHNNSDGFYSSGKILGDNVWNLLVYHEDYNWNSDIKKVDNYSWYDDSTKTAVIMWATDLLPDEIDENDEVSFDETKTNINYVGSLSQNYINEMKLVCSKNGKNFINYGGYSGIQTKSNNRFVGDEDNMNLMRDSYLNFDLRPDQHVKNGYIPCRIFKALSYGCWIGTNSIKMNKFFEGRITAVEDFNELYLSTEEALKNISKSVLFDNKEYIKKNHTYLNRAKILLSIL